MILPLIILPSLPSPGRLITVLTKELLAEVKGEETLLLRLASFGRQ